MGVSARLGVDLGAGSSARWSAGRREERRRPSWKVPGKNITRTKEEARTLAEDILKRAKAGEDFDALVRENTDDRPPGIYKMSNHGVPAPPGGYARGGMVAAFGDVGFPLEVGGIGMAAHDPTKSRYGWHIIKRTE